MTATYPQIVKSDLTPERIASLQAEIKTMARAKNAIVMAHNYQRPEVQDVADFVGDSLALSRQADDTDKEVVVFCGVHFMAETACILSPDKTVLLPNLAAGCSLADTITADEVRSWKAEFPDSVAVGYVNTSAAVKAELDYCCTSGNALEVVDAIPDHVGILFLPDFFLGAHIKRNRPRKLIRVWMGECHVHKAINARTVNQCRSEHPNAEVLIHPECGCAGQVIYELGHGDLQPDGIHITSTEGMIRAAQEGSASEFIVATEVGILHRMRQVAPAKTFLPADPHAVCPYMKTITLEDVRDSLKFERHVITVEESVRARARGALDRMVALG